jgi:hypothetical protein
MVGLESRLILVSALTVFATLANADSDDVVIKASADLSPNLAQLTVTRDDQPIELTDGKLRLVFSDPRQHNEIERILLDPHYRPGTPQAADFFTETKVMSPVTSTLAPETALCNWDVPKNIATCEIEDDGGRFQIVAKRRDTSLQASEFVFRILRLDGFDGFRAGDDKPVNGEADEPHAIFISLKGQAPLDTPIVFEN